MFNEHLGLHDPLNKSYTRLRQNFRHGNQLLFSMLFYAVNLKLIEILAVWVREKSDIKRMSFYTWWAFEFIEI